MEGPYCYEVPKNGKAGRVRGPFHLSAGLSISQWSDDPAALIEKHKGRMRPSNKKQKGWTRLTTEKHKGLMSHTTEK